MARTCTRCRAAVSNQATFCNKCGERLPQGLGASIPAADPSGAPANPYRSPDTGATSRPSARGASSSSERSSSARPSSPRGEPSPSGAREASREEPEAADAGPPDATARARHIVRSFSLWSAAIWILPIPVVDLVVLVPVLTAMIVALASLYNVTVSPRKVLGYLAASTGAYLLGQVALVIIGWTIPFVGKLVGAPFIYGWTYGIGEAAILYFKTSGQATRDEIRDVFRDTSSRATKDYGKEKKVSREEALEALRDHLSPGDMDRLSNTSRSSGPPDLDLDYTQPERILESRITRLFSKAGLATTLAVTVQSPNGEIVIPVLCEVEGRTWAIYIETEPWTPLVVDRLEDWLTSLRDSSRSRLPVRVYSPDPVPAEMERLLLP